MLHSAHLGYPLIVRQKTQHGLNHLLDRGTRVHLQRGGSSQQWLDGAHVPKDPSEFVRILAVRVGGPGGQPLHEYRGRRAQQDDVVELRVEPPLVRLAAADEEHVGVVGREESLDAIFAPDPIRLLD